MAVFFRKEKKMKGISFHFPHETKGGGGPSPAQTTNKYFSLFAVKYRERYLINQMN
jgi:hypothetical protein